MSARRRRAAAYALGALVLALLMAVLASSVDSSTHRGILIAVSLGWLVISAFCVASVLRTETPAAPAPDDPHEGEPVEPA
jgi:MFS-type transporter involved in bile tolerance (Atg22 family)